MESEEINPWKFKGIEALRYALENWEDGDTGPINMVQMLMAARDIRPEDGIIDEGYDEIVQQITGKRPRRWNSAAQHLLAHKFELSGNFLAAMTGLAVENAHHQSYFDTPHFPARPSHRQLHTDTKGNRYIYSSKAGQWFPFDQMAEAALHLKDQTEVARKTHAIEYDREKYKAIAGGLVLGLFLIIPAAAVIGPLAGVLPIALPVVGYLGTRKKYGL